MLSTEAPLSRQERAIAAKVRHCLRCGEGLDGITAILTHFTYDHQMTSAEVARLLGVPRGTVAGWLLRRRVNKAEMALRGAEAIEG